MRINEMRRVGYPAYIRGPGSGSYTEGSFEQLAEVSVWQDKERVTDVSTLLHSAPSMSIDDLRSLMLLELRDAFIAWHARFMTRRGCPPPSAVLRTVTRAVTNSWRTTSSGQWLTERCLQSTPGSAARFTVPGIVAHESARRGGEHPRPRLRRAARWRPIPQAGGGAASSGKVTMTDLIDTLRRAQAGRVWGQIGPSGGTRSSSTTCRPTRY